LIIAPGVQKVNTRHFCPVFTFCLT